uniref:Ubiquitin-like protease family profile domain-containing protein n=1 Tax=Triticum urartu TaxID=4572 RepID=A0A8R7VH22_TRIUA
MKELKATKIIQCDATYIDLGDLAESVRPLGKMSKNVVACGIDFINRHMDMSPDKTIMQYTLTCKIWDGDFHHKILRKHFAAHGDFKLTMKKCVLFPMFQELAPQDPHDKCGHHYAICLDLKNQRFEVLDSMRSEADADLTMHAEYFINNLKETWTHHYEHSKVQIRHFPIEYVATTKQGNQHDCGFHMLEYLAKWEGRRVP